MRRATVTHLVLMLVATARGGEGTEDVTTTAGPYAEVYDRHLTPLGLERGLNALQADGGLLYPPLAR